MKIHDDSLDTFDSKANIEKIISRLNNLAQSDRKFVFRGYNKQEELRPKIIREKDYRNKERELLFDFEKYGSSYFHASTPIDFMSYGQHFGIPTRLLDFTHNPFIALSFALFKRKGTKNTGIDDDDYYFIRYAAISENICLPNIVHRTTWGDLEKPVESLAEKAWSCIANVDEMHSTSGKIEELYRYRDEEKRDLDQAKYNAKTILFIDPNYSNQRIIMQQGLFMFPYTLDESEHMNILENHSDYIKIHKSHRGKLLNYLDTLGYNTFRLMPDLKSVCDAITKKYKGQ